MIESKNNDLIKLIIKLQNSRKKRRKEQQYFTEGWNSFSLACKYKADITQVIAAPEILDPEKLDQLYNTADTFGFPITDVSSAVSKYISLRNNPDGISLLIRIPDNSLSGLPDDRNAMIICPVDISDPGNLGTLIRSADAFGAAGIVLIGQGSTDPYHPRTQLASRGTAFSQYIVETESAEEFILWCREHSIKTVATSAGTGNLLYDRAVFKERTAVLLGNEHTGLEDGVIEMCDETISIPMRGVASSLNVSVAASVIMYEITRMRDLYITNE